MLGNEQIMGKGIVWDFILYPKIKICIKRVIKAFGGQVGWGNIIFPLKDTFLAVNELFVRLH